MKETSTQRSRTPDDETGHEDSGGLMVRVLLVAMIALAAGFGARNIFGVETNYSAVRILGAVIGLLLLLATIQATLRAVAREKWFVFFFIWASLSLFWSQDLGASATTLVAWVLTAVAGAALSSRFSSAVSARIIVIALAIAVGASWMLIFFNYQAASIRSIRPGGTFEYIVTGFFAWNSELGFASAVLGVLALSEWYSQQKAWKLALAVAALASTAASGSVTALVAGAAGVIAVLWVGSRRLRILLSVVALSLAVLWMSGLLAYFYAQVLGWLGRSPDLTGRSGIWDVVMDLVAQHPIVGFGVGAAPDLMPFLGFSANAHNGYLQILLETGVVGLVLIVGMFTFSTVRAYHARSGAVFSVMIVLIVMNFANNFVAAPQIGILLLVWAATTRPTSRSLLPSR